MAWVCVSVQCVKGTGVMERTRRIESNCMLVIQMLRYVPAIAIDASFEEHRGAVSEIGRMS